MRLLLITHYYPEHASGVELVAAQLASRLAARGMSITWVASEPLTQQMPAGIIARPMRTWNGLESATGFAYPLWHPSDLAWLFRALDGHDVIHLHEHLYFGNLIGLLAAHRRRCPAVITQHTSQIWPTPGITVGLRAIRGVLAVSNRTIGRWALGSADQCVFISAQARKYFAGLVRFRRPPLYVPNGVDLAKFGPLDRRGRERLRQELGWPSDRPALLFVGRHIAKKGLPMLLALAKRFPECEWYFAGAGPINTNSWQLPNVHRLGTADQSTLARYYKAADLFVLPSLTEGFPLVVQESLACGTPAMISPQTAQGAPDVESVVLTAELTVGDWEYTLRRALPSINERRGLAAAFSRDNWDWERCTDRYWQVFHELVSTRSKNPATE